MKLGTRVGRGYFGGRKYWRAIKCNGDTMFVSELSSLLYILKTYDESCQTPIKRLKMNFVSRRKWLWNNLLKMCQWITYSRFCKDCKNQNTQTISGSLAIGGTLGQQVDMCKTKVSTLYLLDIFFKDFFIRKNSYNFCKFQKLKNFRLFNNLLFDNLWVPYKSVLKYALIQKNDFVLVWYDFPLVWFNRILPWFDILPRLIFYFVTDRGHQ